MPHVFKVEVGKFGKSLGMALPDEVIQRLGWAKASASADRDRWRRIPTHSLPSSVCRENEQSWEHHGSVPEDAPGAIQI